MIIYFFLLLVLTSEASTLEIPRYFDFKRCNEDTVCFALDKCISGRRGNNELVQQTTSNWDLWSSCGAAVQVKPFSKTKFAIFVRVLKSDEIWELKKDDGIELKITQGNVAGSVTCKPSGVTESGTDYVADRTRVFENQAFDEKIIFCSFVLETSGDVTQSPDYSEITYYYDNNNKKVLKIHELLSKSAENIMCDPDNIVTGNVTIDGFKLSTVNSFVLDVAKSCKGKSLLVKDGQKSLLSTTLECDPSTKEYKYEGSSSVKLEAYCIEEHPGITCDALSPVSPCDACTNVNSGTEAENLQLLRPSISVAWCRKNEWTVDGKTTIFSPTVVCKQLATSLTKGTWFMTNDDEPKEITTASCRVEKIWCNPKLVEVPRCKDDAMCSPVINKEKITCPSGGALKKLMDKTDRMGEKIEDKSLGDSIECDTETGQYTNCAKGNCTLDCEGLRTTVEAEARAYNKSIVIGVSVGGAFLVLIEIGIGVFFCLKKVDVKKKNVKKGEKGVGADKKEDKKEDSSTSKSVKRVRAPTGAAAPYATANQPNAANPTVPSVPNAPGYPPGYPNYPGYPPR